MKNVWIIILGLFVLSSCQPNDDIEVMGLKPVYTNALGQDVIFIAEPQSIVKATKIYKYKQYILVGEELSGIHVYDNTNPSNPVKTHFINIPGNSDMAIRQDVLYANNGSDIVAIDFSNLDNATVYKRLRNVFGGQEEGSNLYPPFYDGYFECVDTSKGDVLRWEEALLINPLCRI